MKFGEKLRRARTDAKLTQAELAKRLGLAKRTVEGYEAGSFYPRDRSVYDRLEQVFGVDKNWFLTEESEEDKKSASFKVEEVLATVRALYAGGELSNDDKDALARALMDAYFIAREKRGEEKKGV